MATRTELYNRIDACGYMKYLDMILFLQSIRMTDESVRSVLIERVKHNGTLSKQDWLLLARTVVWIEDSVITEDTIEEWLLGECNLTRNQLVLVIENVEFIDGEPPTYIIAEQGDFIIAE